MALKLNRDAYQRLIDEDIAAVRASNTDALEREHTIDVLLHSVEMYYPTRNPNSDVEKAWLIVQRPGEIPRIVRVVGNLDDCVRNAMGLYALVFVVRQVHGGHLFVDCGKEFVAIADATVAD